RCAIRATLISARRQSFMHNIPSILATAAFAGGLLVLSGCSKSAPKPTPELESAEVIKADTKSPTPSTPIAMTASARAAEAAEGTPITTEAGATRTLAGYLTTSKTYADGTACLSYDVEDTVTEGYEIAVRELHGGKCPGDPNVSPVRDRFRVTRAGEIQRYDAVSGDYTKVGGAPSRSAAADG